MGGETKNPASYRCQFSLCKRLEVEMMLPKAYRDVNFFLRLEGSQPAPLGTNNRSCTQNNQPPPWDKPNNDHIYLGG